MKEQNKTPNTLSSLENIQEKLEQLEGVTAICAAALDHDEAIDESLLASTFLLIHDQVEEIRKRTQALIVTATENMEQANY